VAWFRRAPAPEVVVYTRQGCGLCRRAEELVRREAWSSVVSTVDIDTDPDLIDRYTVRVPVVTVDGREVAELEVAPGEIRRAVARARRSRR
jgi:glutaredoxin